jgi:hypothetical protein
MPHQDKLLAALLNAFIPVVAALASSAFGLLAPSLRQDQILSFESKRLAVIESWLRIRSQCSSSELAKGELDRILAPLLESSIRAVADVGAAQQVYTVRFFQDWFLLRRPHIKLLWPLQVAFYLTFVMSFVVLRQTGPGQTFVLLATLTAVFRLVVGLVERNIGAVPNS